MRSVCSLARHQVRQLFGTPRPYIVIFGVFCILLLIFRGTNTYLAQTGQRVQAIEFFVFSHGSAIEMICFAGLLVLVSDAPFLREGLPYCLIRTDRLHWLLGQTLACAAICAIYLACTAVMFPLLFPGRVSFQNDWSRPARIAAMVPTGAKSLRIQGGVEISMRLLTHGKPWGMFLLSFLYSFLLYMLLCVLLSVCNLRFRAPAGLLVVTAWLLLWYATGSLITFKWLRLLSPFHLASLNERSFAAGDTLYSLLFFPVLSTVLWLAALRATKGTDFMARQRAE